MMIGNAITLALREIRRNLLRAALTTFGIVIGVGAVIAMVTIGNGARASVANSIESMGSNLIILQPGTRRGPGGGGATSASAFTQADVDTITREVANVRVAGLATRAATVVAGNRNHPTQIAGTNNAYLGVRDWPVIEGRIFTEAELRSGRSVCVLGQTVKTELFGAQEAVGADIRVGNVPCEVVGLLQPKGQSTFGQDQDDLVVMPLRTVQRRLAGNLDIGTIWVGANRAGDILQIKEQITEILRERRHIGEGEEDDFQVADMQEIASLMDSTAAILTTFLAAIAAISLVVGGIGIMNIMLVSVTERTREIGIRLAIGARMRDVLTQFLVEAVMMSTLGGIAGIGLGMVASATAVYFFGIPFVPSLWIVLVAFLFSAGIGVAFGYFPARRAARLDPIEALRHE
jgi:putative ABC transport system permease protein